MLTNTVRTSALAFAAFAFCAAVSGQVTQPDIKGDWSDIDQRMVFLTTQLASVETSLDAVTKQLRVSGYKQTIKQDDAARARKGNELMDRNLGMPTTIRWEQFYGRTAEKFFYHPTDANSSYHTTTVLAQRPPADDTQAKEGVTSRQGLPVQQRPPQFDYIYRANSDSQKLAEADVAKLAGKANALVARRSQLEAEQSALWCKIAFRPVVGRELLSKPLYCFDLKTAAAGDAATERLEALRATMTFLRTANQAAEEAETAVDVNQADYLKQLANITAKARKALDLALLQQPSIALEVGETSTTIGKLSAVAKRLSDVAKNISDAYRLAQDGAAAGDEQRKNTFRGLLQEALVTYSESILAGDECAMALAREWKIIPDVKSAISSKQATAVEPAKGGDSSLSGSNAKSGTPASSVPGSNDPASTDSKNKNRIPDNGKNTLLMMHVLIDEKGKCTMNVRPISDADSVFPQAHGEKTETEVAGIHGAKVFSLADGRTDVQYDFTNVTSVDDLFDPIFHPAPNADIIKYLRLNGNHKGLQISPIQQEDGHFELEYPWPRQMILPLQIRVVFYDIPAGRCFLGFYFAGTTGKNAGDHVDLDLWGKTDDEKRPKPGAYFATWYKNDGKDRIVLGTGFVTDKPDSDHSMALPLTALEQQRQSCTFRIGTFGSPVGIRTLEVTAQIAARIGVGIDGKDGKAVISKVGEGPASDAGLKVGDLIIAVNETECKDADDALTLISKLTIGTPAHFSLLRTGQRLTIDVKPF